EAETGRDRILTGYHDLVHVDAELREIARGASIRKQGPALERGPHGGKIQPVGRVTRGDVQQVEPRAGDQGNSQRVREGDVARFGYVRRVEDRGQLGPAQRVGIVHAGARGTG